MTIKHKLISTKSNELLTFLNSREILCFDFDLAKKALPDSKDSALRELLTDMTRRGLFMRVKRGLYHVIPYEKDPEYFMPDWHLLPEFLIEEGEYYIGYYSALQIHNLITQPSLQEQIVVSKQQRPSVLKIKNVPFQFIFHNEKHFFGKKKMWIDDYNKVFCSDLEKTIVDCLFKPDYAGGIVEVTRAIYVSREKIKFDLLLEYIIKFNSQAVIKRLGFLLELLKIKTVITAELEKLKTSSVVLLDTELPKGGKIKTKWSIMQNIETETIKTAIYT
ncbi:MAG: transcriptional regulator [Candidatus Delongbacteria bacterium]|jgi:predicted transcriptional regulator of viral defense system|nr:transcriptional regulator [Candidatus Delongbacteria bacterium]